MQKQEFNFVVGFVEDNRQGLLIDGRTIYNPEKTIRLEIDYSKSITLQRCAEIMAAARKLSGRDLAMISIRHSIYSKSPDNECGDFPETCYLDKHYDYDARTNSLTIYDRGVPVYANDNGVVCRDQVALFDCR